MPNKERQVEDVKGTDGDAFAIMSKVKSTLVGGGKKELVKPFLEEAMSSDYDHLLQTCHEYVVVM